jgi:O-antigen/teichoic acid export membrane protein
MAAPANIRTASRIAGKLGIVDRLLIKRTVLVTGGRIFFLGLWFVALTAAYRHLGKLEGGLAQAGVLAFTLASIKLVTTALGDPLDLDVVRRVPPVLASDPRQAIDVWRAAQQFRLFFGAIVVCAAFIAAGPVAMWVLDGAPAARAIVIGGAAAAAELVYRGYLADYQSRERFSSFVGLEGMLQVIRVASVFTLMLWGGLSVTTFLAAYALSTFAVVIFAFGVAEPERKRLWTFDLTSTVETWRYIRWIAPAMILSAVVERLDIFLLASLRGASEAGMYGALMPIILIPEMVIGFASGVLQPRVADLAARGRLLPFWFAVCRITVPLALIGCIVAIWLSGTMIHLSIGDAYLPAARVLTILLLAVLFWFAFVPVALSYVVMMQPRTTLLICVVQAVIVLMCGLYLIPRYGTLGAALSVAIMRCVIGSVICVSAWVRIRQFAGSGKAMPV